MSTGTMGVGFYDAGRSARTRDWSRPPESETVKPKTATEIAADAFLAQKDRWKREAEADERRKAEEWQRQKEAERKKHEEFEHREQVERDNKRRAAEFVSAEFQITATFDQHGLTESERLNIGDALTERQLWRNPMAAVEYAVVEALRIVAERK